jgi:DNA-binding NarL/FixJ family response regulator
VTGLPDPDTGARQPLRVVIADDEVLLRAGVAMLLQNAGMVVVAQVSRGDEVRAAVELHRPDVLITDVQMPPDSTDDGLRAAIEIRQLGLGTAVLVMSNFLEERYPLDLIGDDATGVGCLLGHAGGQRRVGPGP